MPVDRLELICDRIKWPLLKLAREKGKPSGGYRYFLDLAKTEPKLPVKLYCDGRHSGIHKIQFEDVAHLGLTMVRKVTDEIFGNPHHVRIYRIDICADIYGMSLLDLALYCRVARAQNCCVERSRSGITFYLRYSKNFKILFYDKIAQLRSRQPSTADWFRKGEMLTRIEVQMRGRSALPYWRFADIEKYADLELLKELSFKTRTRKRENLKPMEALAAEGLLAKIDDWGVQMTSKMYPPSTWAYLQKKFLRPVEPGDFPDLNQLLRRSTRDWMENRPRFPRTGRHSRKLTKVSRDKGHYDRPALRRF
jgi:hypothetical protein